MIAFVWTAATILLPVIHSEKTYHNLHLFAMAIERFLFVFAITIPFDIRDMIADRQDYENKEINFTHLNKLENTKRKDIVIF
ncbi:MAG: hypothetical protein IPL33_08940 [Sphingobacteriales bacterium]|nr:hypothetical protein [Sphingobacteriales bacterium]